MKKSKLKFCFLFLIFFSFITGAQARNEETPPYKNLYSEGPFQVRSYPKMLVAKATRKNGDNLFRTIADYIFGNNENKEEIPMTAPVFSFWRKNYQTMMFYMPSNYQSLEELPLPNNEEVTLGNFSLGKVAVVRFSGYNSERAQRKNLSRLRKWINKNGLEIRSNSYYSAVYDSPYVPARKRTNEVIIKLK